MQDAPTKRPLLNHSVSHFCGHSLPFHYVSRTFTLRSTLSSPLLKHDQRLSFPPLIPLRSFTPTSAAQPPEPTT